LQATGLLADTQPRLRFLRCHYGRRLLLDIGAATPVTLVGFRRVCALMRLLRRDVVHAVAFPSFMKTPNGQIPFNLGTILFAFFYD